MLWPWTGYSSNPAGLGEFLCAARSPMHRPTAQSGTLGQSLTRSDRMRTSSDGGSPAALPSYPSSALR